MALKHTTSGYDSTASFSDCENPVKNLGTLEYKKSYHEDNAKQPAIHNKLQYCSFLRSLNAYERHKIFINNYFLNNPHAKTLMKRDDSNDKRDVDVIKENHQFLWEDDASLSSWGKQLARKYYNKLFKEYCICDLSRYKEGLVGMRWRTQKEVKDGKGQFTCGEKHCGDADKLRTWEMNFGYIEQEVKKNALIKLRLCNSCSYKLNYKHKRKEIKHSKSRRKSRGLVDMDKSEKPMSVSDIDPKDTSSNASNEDIWKGPSKAVEVEDQNDEFEEYLEDLFL